MKKRAIFILYKNGNKAKAAYLPNDFLNKLVGVVCSFTRVEDVHCLIAKRLGC